MLNAEGWILTASHIVEKCLELSTDSARSKDVAARIAAIRGDAKLNNKERGSQLKSLPKLAPDATAEFSAWWGIDGVQLVDIIGVGGLDLAVGRLEPFDPKQIATYPVVKDPTKDYDPGVSLCKLGYPFHQITPIWHADKNAFELPPGSVPPPFFPIEGILTRFLDLKLKPGEDPHVKFPTMHIETSSPGLKGQSGGPIFDAQGTIWAIQCVTANYPLGFDPPVPGTNGKVKVHQFLNVGRGVHAVSIVGLLQQLGVKFQLSAY